MIFIDSVNFSYFLLLCTILFKYFWLFFFFLYYSYNKLCYFICLFIINTSSLCYFFFICFKLVYSFFSIIRNRFTYRSLPPRSPQWTFYVADGLNAFMWWWIFVHLWYQPGHVFVCAKFYFVQKFILNKQWLLSIFQLNPCHHFFASNILDRSPIFWYIFNFCLKFSL